MRENRKYFGLRGKIGSVVGADKLFMLLEAFTLPLMKSKASRTHQPVVQLKINQLKIPNSNEKNSQTP
jgi:hypothetical protein